MRDLLPPLFLDRMAALLGGPESAEYRAFAAGYDRPPVAGLRANTLKVSPAELAARLPFALAPVPWSADGFILQDADESPAGRPGKHPYHAAGLYYLQEPSALVPVELLAPQPGERVLDLSAAPGGKATHIAAAALVARWRPGAFRRTSTGPSGVFSVKRAHPSTSV